MLERSTLCSPKSQRGNEWNPITMNDPLAFFLTWSTYGSWLPGDASGWTEYHHGWQMPAPALELECKARMTEDSESIRKLVLS